MYSGLVCEVYVVRMSVVHLLLFLHGSLTDWDVLVTARSWFVIVTNVT